MISPARVLLTTLALVATLVVSLAHAHAARPKRVLVFPLSGSVPGDAKGNAPARLTQVVARSAGLTGADVTIGEVSFEDASTLAGCAETGRACLAQVAKALHVDHVVLGSIGPGADRAHVKVTLIAYVNETVSERSFDLPAGDVDTMVEQLAREAPELFMASAPAEPEPAPAPVAAPAAATTPPPSPPPARRGHIGTGTWILAGGGAVLAGTGVVLLALASSKQDDVDAAPTSTAAELDHLASLEDDGARLTTAGNVLLVGGGAIVLTGAVIAIVQLTSPDRDHGDATRDARVSLRPLWLGRGAGLSLELSWP